MTRPPAFRIIPDYGPAIIPPVQGIEMHQAFAIPSGAFVAHLILNIMKQSQCNKNLSPKALLLDFYGTLVEEDDMLIQRICHEIAADSGTDPIKVGIFWKDTYTNRCRQSYGKSFRLQKELERSSTDHVIKRFNSNLDADTLSQYFFNYPVKGTKIAYCQEHQYRYPPSQSMGRPF
jgi:hypothetical protein